MSGDAETTGRAVFKAAHANRIRDLSAIEHLLYARTKAWADSCGLASAKYENCTTGPDSLDKSTLFPALAQVVRNNGALAANISPSLEPNGLPFYFRLPSVDLDRIVEYLDVDSRELQAVMEAQFLRPFDLNADRPLWRLAVLRDGTIVFAYDHVIGDGKSGVAFLRQLLAALNAQRPPELCSDHDGGMAIVHVPPSITLPPPPEALPNVAVPSGQVAQAVMDCVKLQQQERVWTGNPVPATFELAMSVHLFHYSRADTAQVLRLARAHGATLTSFLYTLAVVVLSRIITAHCDEATYKYALMFVPMSLRQFTGASSDDICNHVSFWYTQHPLYDPAVARMENGEAFPWADAAALARTLRRETQQSRAMFWATKKMLEMSESMDAVVRGAFGKPRSIGFEITNMGAFDPPWRKSTEQEETWKIRDAMMALGDGATGAALKLAVVGTPTGGLGLSISYGKSAVDEDFAEAFVQGFVEELRMLLAERSKL